MRDKWQRFVMMNGQREVLKYAESGTGIIELDAWDENALRSYTVYGNTVCSVKFPSPETPGTLSSVGDYNPLTGKYRLSVKATNENLMGPDEFLALMAERVPGILFKEERGFVQYLLPQTTGPWNIVTTSELRFYPWTTYTCCGLFYEVHALQSERYSGIELGFSESAYQKFTISMGSEIMYARVCSYKQLSINRILMRYVDDTYRGFSPTRFGIYLGTRSDTYYVPHAERQTTLVLPKPLRGIQDDTEIRADSVNSLGNVLWRVGEYRFHENDNMAPYSVGTYPVFYVQLKVPGDPTFPKVTSDMLKYVNRNAMGTVANACCLNSTGTGILFTLGTDTTYDDARNFLLEQNPTFVYALRDITTETVSGVMPKVFRDYNYTCVLSKTVPLLYTVNYV